MKTTSLQSMQPMLHTAEQAALAAGKIIMQFTNRLDVIKRSPKGYNDMVTEVDLRAEQVIIEMLRQAYPQHAILSEEQYSQLSVNTASDNQPNDEAAKHDAYQQIATNQDMLWVVDPLDGTLNFSHGFPFYNVSIALLYQQKLQVAVIFDPIQNELFSATRGGGAFLNQKRIRVSQTPKLGMSLLGTGFPFKYPDLQTTYLQSMGRAMRKCAGIRRAGAAALDLAYVACGRLDGFWELGLQPWDMAAGILLIQEAGGICASLQTNSIASQPSNPLHNGHLVAANPHIMGALQSCIDLAITA